MRACIGTARAVTAGSADTAAARQRLKAAQAAMVDGERPDLQLPLLIELTADQAPADAMRQLDAVCTEATRLGHQGPVLAARVRSAAVAAPVDPVRARRDALATLALAERHQTTALLPAELWLHSARALEAAGDRARAREVAATGRQWVEATAAEHVPKAFRDSFRHRNPINRELLALVARVQA